MRSDSRRLDQRCVTTSLIKPLQHVLTLLCNFSFWSLWMVFISCFFFFFYENYHLKHNFENLWPNKQSAFWKFWYLLNFFTFCRLTNLNFIGVLLDFMWQITSFLPHPSPQKMCTIGRLKEKDYFQGWYQLQSATFALIPLGKKKKKERMWNQLQTHRNMTPPPEMYLK